MILAPMSSHSDASDSRHGRSTDISHCDVTTIAMLGSGASASCCRVSDSKDVDIPAIRLCLGPGYQPLRLKSMAGSVRIMIERSRVNVLERRYSRSYMTFFRTSSTHES